ncbi:hypothetical protein H0H87_005205 [Tephrocybe sp. NHM501043]|nr:hypothetical protein H0H87_005205 [Tephrocybe sp. NHM501043]
MADAGRSSNPRPSTQRPTLLLNNKHAATPIPPGLQAKMAAFANRSPPSVDAATHALQATSIITPVLHSGNSFPPQLRPRLTGLAARRTKPAFSLRDIDPDIVPSPSGGAAAAGLGAGRPSLALDPPKRPNPANFVSPFSNFSKIVDPSGALNFKGKAILHAAGVNFSSGASFNINMSQLQLDVELGRGNYGTVKKVLHKPTNVAMAMKEIRLELDDAKLNAIIMELDILHRAVAPEIVEFYGAFFIESCVYYCMEFMDAGSLDKLQGAGVPESILGRIASSMVRGLKFLKDDLQIIHRGPSIFRHFTSHSLVPQTSSQQMSSSIQKARSSFVILACRDSSKSPSQKQISGVNLIWLYVTPSSSVPDLHLTQHTGHQPERIKGESLNNLGTYTVSSDVWSLGLSMIEIAIGQYPFPPETYANVFAQLTAIVHGDPPDLPEDRYTAEARDWVAQCLAKKPEDRATYQELLDHPFLKADAERDVDMVTWVKGALDYWDKKLAKEREAAVQAQAAQLTPATQTGLPASGISSV